MATITEDYVSFETAKLLKEKGFDELCYQKYDSDGELSFNHVGYVNSEKPCDDFYALAPTLQMAMKWLREVHHIYTEICLYKTNEDDIEPKKSRKAPYYTFGIWDSVTGNNVDKRLTNDFIGDTYERACEAAIKYCLEDLI